jgi:hypothetical protein
MPDVVRLLRQNGVRNEFVETFAVGDDGAAITFSQEEHIMLKTFCTREKNLE